MVTVRLIKLKTNLCFHTQSSLQYKWWRWGWSSSKPISVFTHSLLLNINGAGEVDQAQKPISVFTHSLLFNINGAGEVDQAQKPISVFTHSLLFNINGAGEFDQAQKPISVLTHNLLFNINGDSEADQAQDKSLFSHTIFTSISSARHEIPDRLQFHLCQPTQLRHWHWNLHWDGSSFTWHQPRNKQMALKDTKNALWKDSVADSQSHATRAQRACLRAENSKINKQGS